MPIHSCKFIFTQITFRVTVFYVSKGDENNEDDNDLFGSLNCKHTLILFHNETMFFFEIIKIHGS